MLRSLLIAGLALALLTPAIASAQDEKIGTLGRTFIRQGIAVDKCGSTNDCTLKMTRVIKTAGLIATRASKLMDAGDTGCMLPSVKFATAWTKKVEPAVRGWQRRPGHWQAKKAFTDAILKVAATLPDLYHKC